MLLRRGHNRYLVVVATFFLTSLVCFYNGGSLATFREFSPSWGGASSSRSSSSSFKTSPKSGSGKTFVTAQKPLGTANVELVVATTKKDNVTWLHDYLLDLPKNLYVVDDPSAPLTVPKNKGREAMVILTYLIDRYDTLPANILFHHAERFQWHNDDPDYDALQLLKRFRTQHLQEQGYVNLRCAWILGCPVEIRPRADADAAPENDIPTAKHIYARAYRELFPGKGLPDEVGVPCCSQFGVTRETVRSRPREEYVRFREWLMHTKLDDAISGRVFEYAWHMIFNKESVHCPHAGDCYCKQYGMCHRLDCDKERCPGQYYLPKYSNLPKGWPMIGWDGEDREWTGEL